VVRDRLLESIDYVTALAELRNREINYDPGEVRPPHWNFDVHRSVVGRERPGPPEPHAVWETARDLVRDYEFTPPELIRAVYHRLDPLLGRNLLLEGRFFALRFYMGCASPFSSTRPETNRTRYGGGLIRPLSIILSAAR
jgi:hypothetical protein